MKDIRTESKKWASETFESQLKKLTNKDNREIIEKTTECLRKLNLLNKKVNGYAAEGLQKNQEGNMGKRKNYTEIFHDLEKSDELTPVNYLLKLIEDHKENGKVNLEGVIARGIRTFTSLLREPDFAVRIDKKLKARDEKATARTATAEEDAKGHTDVIAEYKGKTYLIWLYQLSDNGIPHDIERISGKRGELLKGIHILCPLRTELTDKYHKLLKNTNKLKQQIKDKENELLSVTERQKAKRKTIEERLEKYNKAFIEKGQGLLKEKAEMEQELEVEEGWYLYSEKYIQRVCNFIEENGKADSYKEIQEKFVFPREYVSKLRKFEKV
jgi:hypothetical protein